MRNAVLPYALTLCVLVNAWFPATAGVTSKVTGEIIEETLDLAARRSGREISERTAKKAATETLERLTKTYGDDVLRIVREGGIELVEAVPKYGDEVIEVALKSSPAARRALAKNVPELLPLAKRVGAEAIELEAKSPGLATKVFKTFGDDAGLIVAKNIPTEDVPRFLLYAEKADSPATRDLLLKSYQKEGPSLFERIPAKLVLAGSLTGAMLYGTHELTEPARAMGDAIRKNDDVAVTAIQASIRWGAICIFVVIVSLLWRFRLMPWHGSRKKPAVGSKEEPKTEISEQ